MENNYSSESSRIKALESLHLLDTPAEEQFDRHTRLLQRLLNSSISLITFIDRDRAWVKSASGINYQQVKTSYDLHYRAIEQNAMIICNDAQNNAQFAGFTEVTEEPQFRSFLIQPIKDKNGLCIGTLSIFDVDAREFAEEDLEWVRQITASIEYDIHLLQKSTLDHLTGTSNATAFHTAAAHILALCNRSSCEATLVLFDLPAIGKINAYHSHEAGDLVIEAFGKLLLETFRSSDVVSRLKGDQFAVLLTHGDNVDFHIPIQRLLTKLDEFNKAIDFPELISPDIRYIHYNKDQFRSIDELLNAQEKMTKVADAKGKLLEPA